MCLVDRVVYPASCVLWYVEREKLCGGKDNRSAKLTELLELFIFVVFPTDIHAAIRDGALTNGIEEGRGGRFEPRVLCVCSFLKTAARHVNVLVGRAGLD
jgi:hypothetical protein